MNDYNFFEVYGRKSSFEISLRSPYFIGAVVILLCILMSLGLLTRNFIMGRQIVNIHSQISTIQASPEYLKAVQLSNSIDAMKQYDSSADGVMSLFEKNNVISTELLETLSAQLPVTVTLTNFNMDNASANFTFNAPTRKAVSELVLRLKNSGLFQDVSFNSVTTTETGGVEVTINAVMKAGEAE